MKARRSAKQRAMQENRRYRARMQTTTYLFWPISVEHDEHPANQTEKAIAPLRMPIPRPRSFQSEGPVDVYVDLTYPFTNAVPEEVRTRNFQATTIEDVCREIRRIYAAIYAVDATLLEKGEATKPISHAEEHALITQLEAKGARMLNRPTGPWIWGMTSAI